MSRTKCAPWPSNYAVTLPPTEWRRRSVCRSTHNQMAPENSPSHGENRGSSPLGSANEIKELLQDRRLVSNSCPINVYGQAWTTAHKRRPGSSDTAPGCRGPDRDRTAWGPCLRQFDDAPHGSFRIVRRGDFRADSGGRSWRSGCVLAHPSDGELARRAEPQIIVGAQQVTLAGNSGGLRFR